MVKIQSYNTLKKDFVRVKQTSYKRLLKIQRLERRIERLEKELNSCEKKIKEQELLIGWLNDTKKPLETYYTR